MCGTDRENGGAALKFLILFVTRAGLPLTVILLENMA